MKNEPTRARLRAQARKSLPTSTLETIGSQLFTIPHKPRNKLMRHNKQENEMKEDQNEQD